MRQTDLLEILNHIDPGALNYQDWVNVGMALKQEGYSVSAWDDWSQRDRGRYHRGECQRKWNSFNGAGTPVTGGTIFQLAKDQGWVPESDPGYELDWNDQITREDGVIIDKNWVEGREVREPENWNPKAELITYLETLFDSTDNVGYVTHSFEKEGKHMSGEQLHTFLDNIEKTHGLYSPPALGLAAAIACCGFTFLLGGGPIEMFCAFVGAGIGNYLRCKLTKHHFTLFLCIVSSVSLACFAYAGLLKLGEILFGISVQHEAGYICAMLFIIPGFPFITSGIDLAKLDMRSGIERLTYALIVILVATMSAWIMALILHLKPVDFIKLSLSTEQWILFRLLASFCGVFGFSIMFNSPVRLAVAAAGIGAAANTLRLELVDLANIPPAAAAFIGALTAGLLASLLKNKVGYPRISVTVPSIVIMVPGLYLYRGFYNLGIMSLSVAASWFASAILIIAALPLGLIFARILTDKAFRYCT